jgi:CarD family transcriptional regulator
MSKSLVGEKATPSTPLAKIASRKKPTSSKVATQAQVAAPLTATTSAVTSAVTSSVIVTKPEIKTPSKSIREKITEKMREKRALSAETMGPIDFKVGDHAVYPSYGVGTVVAIESKEIMGSRCDFYVVMIRDTGMKVMVPKSNVSSVGLRPVISRQEATKVIEILKTTEVRIDNQTWNRRYREYMEKIKTGSVYEIAEVLRDLFLLKVDKELSYGERNMLDTARKLLMRELSLAVDKDELTREDEVRQIFGL